MKNWQEYEKWVDLKTTYGATFVNDKWEVKLWHPFAKNVELIIYDKENQNLQIKKISGKFNKPNWEWTLKEGLDGFFYNYLITQENGSVNLALDPYAKSMAAFNWEGKAENIGKGAFVKFEQTKKRPLNKATSHFQPIIYETSIRDLTSLRNDVKNPGSFQAIQKIKLAKHLKDLGITHVQFLPIHSCYALNELDQNILNKGEGNGWETNYNWGYDPHNYFSINGWYSSNPSDPYSRINEFKKLVNYLHKNNIKVIVDVVYNHVFNNAILNNVIPGYYFRNESKTFPVDQPPLASERAMARRIIIDSLVHFVKNYYVDGFRFDLATFIDKDTIIATQKILKKINPDILLHGEAWDFTDLPIGKAFNKLHLDNDFNFAYFNDTTRDAIKGKDDGDEFSMGLISNNNKTEFSNYLAGIIGGIANFKQDVPNMATDRYSRFTSYPNNSLQYVACHDGHTLWDKINLTTKGNKEKKIEYYRQALMMQQLTMGRSLLLGGTELLYTKPNDKSGQDGERFHSSKSILDLFNLGIEYNENTYKTTDYSAGLRWNHLDKYIKKNVYNFLKKLNNFRKNSEFFNLSTEKAINKSLSFQYVSSKEGIIDFNLKCKKKEINVVHNFGNAPYKLRKPGKVILNSHIKSKSKHIVEAHSSILIEIKK